MCSDNSLSRLDLEVAMEDDGYDNSDNFYFIFEENGYLDIVKKKDGVYMKDQNYNDATFSNITFTITGFDS